VSAPVLEVESLRIEIRQGEEYPAAVHDVSLEVAEGEIVGLIGESGSGKSLTCRSAIRLTPPAGRVASGSIKIGGRDLLAMGHDDLRQLRAHEVGMVFQDPFSSLNPVLRIDTQIVETLRSNLGLSKSAAKKEAIRLLDSVGIPEPERWARAYPHELSGGMRQRVMIALATAAEPKLLIADEPTTALDVTTQAQILELLRKLRDERGVAVLIVSHDFGVIAQTCDRVVVMYGGHIVETGPVKATYENPQHPYTRALLASVPTVESAAAHRRREAIPGRPPELGEDLPGCVFAPRCPYAKDECLSIEMNLEPAAPGQKTACPFIRAGEGGAIDRIASGGEGEDA